MDFLELWHQPRPSVSIGQPREVLVDMKLFQSILQNGVLCGIIGLIRTPLHKLLNVLAECLINLLY